VRDPQYDAEVVGGVSLLILVRQGLPGPSRSEICRFRQFWQSASELQSRAQMAVVRPDGSHNEAQSGSFRANHTQAFGLQNGCRTRAERRGEREKSLQTGGGRTWIRTRDLFLIRQAQ